MPAAGGGDAATMRFVPVKSASSRRRWRCIGRAICW